jgi:hypothetical protein
LGLEVEYWKNIGVPCRIYTCAMTLCFMGKYGRCRAKGGVSKSVGKCVGCGKEETDSGGSVVKWIQCDEGELVA